MMNGGRKLSCLVFTFALLFAFVLITTDKAIALTMTFDDIAGSPTCNSSAARPESYTEDGMTVRSLSSFEHVHICDNDGDGSSDLRNHRGSALHIYEFEYLGGTLFDLLSFDIGVRTGWNPGRSTFTSNLGGLITIDTTGTISFSGSGWTGISWLRWEQGTNTNFSRRRNNTLMDNLVFAQSVAPVPEPSTIVLFGTGLLAFVSWRRFKKQ